MTDKAILRPINRKGTDLSRLLTLVISAPQQRHDEIRGVLASPWARTAVCMNPDRACEDCIFNEGPSAKWCLPHERSAKAVILYDGRSTNLVSE